MNIEDTIYEDSLAVNTIAMLNRGIEILKSINTNSALSLKENNYFEELFQYRRLLWLLNSQIHGQLGIIDMSKEWDILVSKNNFLKIRESLGIKDE